MSGAGRRPPLVGIVVISHSARISEGVTDLARVMAGPDVPIVPVGGEGEGRLGVVVSEVVKAIESADVGAGAVLIADLGNAVHAAETALELLPSERAASVRVSRGPLVEGAVIAAVQASIGQSVDEVVHAADEALRVKLER